MRTRTKKKKDDEDERAARLGTEARRSIDAVIAKGVARHVRRSICADDLPRLADSHSSDCESARQASKRLCDCVRRFACCVWTVRCELRVELVDSQNSKSRVPGTGEVHMPLACARPSSFSCLQTLERSAERREKNWYVRGNEKEKDDSKSL